MRKVYFIFFCKRYFLNSLALKIYFSIVLLWGVFSTISVGNVFNNMMDSGIGFGRTMYFYKYAFMHTELIVQSVVVLTLIFVSLLLIDSLRGIVPSRRSNSLEA